MKKFEDGRGILFFPIKNNEFVSKETTISINHKNVFRGIHINNFKKLVTCVQGKILDIIINFNPEAEDYLIPQYFNLDPSTDFFQLLIPENYGHAFLSLEDNSILVYNFSEIFQTARHINYLDPFINLKFSEHDISNLIISEKDLEKNFVKPIDYVIFGSKGYIGSVITNYLKLFNKNFIISDLRLEERESIEHFLEYYNPKYVINAAGLTGSPNIFWCDSHREETIQTNVICQISMMNICKKLGIKVVIIGSGAIFDDEKFYDENDEGNFTDNFYAESRILLEKLVKNYDNYLYLRINCPISNNSNPKNLITKLLLYKTVNDCELSITYLDDLIPILFEMIENHETGICNFTNPGTITLNTICQIFEKIDYQLMPKIYDKRSNPKLKVEKILKYNPMRIENALINCKTYYKNG